MTRRTWVIALTFVVCTLLAARSRAQDRQTVFLHGFGSEASDWSGQANHLHGRVAIEPRLPEFSWRQPFSTQVRELQQGLSWVPDDAVAVGHSNGGLLARSWSRAHRLGGIVTIGTPHRGTPIVPHFFQWSGFQAGTFPLLNRVVDAFTRWSDWGWITWYIEQSMNWLSDFSIWSVAGLAGTLGFDAAMPVAEEMVPGSPFLLGLNASSNLSREATEVPSRVGIVSVAHNFYWAGPARAIVPDQADEVAALMYGAAYGLLYWSGYVFTEAAPTDIAATQQSLSMMGLAEKILEVDSFYCRMVSRIDFSECLANDGIVTDESQQFPGAPNFVIGLDNDGPAHKLEKQRAGDALYEALVWYTHVPPRPGFPGTVPGLPPPAQIPPEADPGDAPSPPPPSSAPEVVASGRELHAGETIDSADGRYHLSYQGDGNLVLYDEYWNPTWASDTAGTEPGVAAMQGDGNFVIYSSDWTPLWASGDSWGHPGATLVVQNDGNVVIYDPDGTPLWATGTAR